MGGGRPSVSEVPGSRGGDRIAARDQWTPSTARTDRDHRYIGKAPANGAFSEGQGAVGTSKRYRPHQARASKPLADGAGDAGGT